MEDQELHGIPLKDHIIEILRGDGKSISGIYKELKNTDNAKIHRLELTGYLKAMTDFGLLKEKYVKPSKIYYLNKKDGETIYDFIKEKLQNEEDHRAEKTLYVLYKIFERPIFSAELEKAGVISISNAKRIDKKERKRILEKIENKDVRLTPEMEAFIPQEQYPDLAIKILSDIISEKFKFKKGSNGVQKKLEL